MEGITMKAPLQSEPLPPVSVGAKKQKRFRGVTYEWLYYKYVICDMTALDIAKEIDATQPNVRKWLIKHGMTYASQEKRRIEHAYANDEHIDPDPHAPARPVIFTRGRDKRSSGVTYGWLFYKYHTRKMNTTEIAKEMGVSEGTICRWMDEHKVARRSKSEYRKRRHMTGSKNAAWKGGVGHGYHVRLLKDSDRPYVCIWCGFDEKLQVHHIDHNKKNGVLDNLAWMCGPCNRMEAHLNALVKAGRATYMQRGSELTITFSNRRIN